MDGRVNESHPGQPLRIGRKSLQQLHPREPGTRADLRLVPGKTRIVIQRIYSGARESDRSSYRAELALALARFSLAYELSGIFYQAFLCWSRREWRDPITHTNVASGKFRWKETGFQARAIIFIFYLVIVYIFFYTYISLFFFSLRSPCN